MTTYLNTLLPGALFASTLWITLALVTTGIL